jgi:hypothetical protein
VTTSHVTLILDRVDPHGFRSPTKRQLILVSKVGGDAWARPPTSWSPNSQSLTPRFRGRPIRPGAATAVARSQPRDYFASAQSVVAVLRPLHRDWLPPSITRRTSSTSSLTEHCSHRLRRRRLEIFRPAIHEVRISACKNPAPNRTLLAIRMVLKMIWRST